MTPYTTFDNNSRCFHLIVSAHQWVQFCAHTCWWWVRFFLSRDNYILTIKLSMDNIIRFDRLKLSFSKSCCLRNNVCINTLGNHIPSNSCDTFFNTLSKIFGFGLLYTFINPLLCNCFHVTFQFGFISDHCIRKHSLSVSLERSMNCVVNACFLASSTFSK